MPRFRKRTFEVEAQQFTGDNAEELAEWCGAKLGSVGERPVLWLEGLDSVIRVNRGDWVIRNLNGGFSACTPSGFNAIYEPIEGGAYA